MQVFIAKMYIYDIINKKKGDLKCLIQDLLSARFVAVIYGKMKDFGLTPYQSGYCYICEKCGSYVGTHRKSPKDALGILACSNTRKLRSICHEEFDKHYYSLTGKNRAYYRLSKELNIKFDDCHFGYMDAATLSRALNIMKGWEKACFR
mgnify:CR=1 FL=1